MKSKMYTNTLSGVFPPPKPQHKRNFVKENVRQIKRIQSIIHEMGTSSESQARPTKDKYQTVPVKVPGNRSLPLRIASKVTRKSSNDVIPSKKVSDRNMRKGTSTRKSRGQKVNTEVKLIEDNALHSQESSGISGMKRHDKLVTRGIQTEKAENLDKLSENGVIKYPSENVMKQLSKKNSPRREEKKMGSGDASASPGITRIFDDKTLTEKMANLNAGEKPHDFIKQNILSLRQKQNKQGTKPNPNEPPPNYQMGHLPKYLKDRKEEQMKEVENLDTECPDGHVLLPDEERRETLRVLRQSYADRIQELNSMPVRNDTLRMKKRKMELEEELKKIDEGIKVFQRPKVYVKVNA